MSFWWVSQNKTWKHERSGGYLWAPFEGSDGVDRYYWRNMEEVQCGDIIFSYQGKKIQAVSIAKYDCYHAPIPPEFGANPPWKSEGRRVDVEYFDLVEPMLLDRIIEDIRPFLGAPQFPIKKDGKGGKEGYLFRVDEILGNILLDICGLDRISSLDVEKRSFDNLDNIEITTRKRLVDARVGQGFFRDQLIRKWQTCAVTGTSAKSLLYASHIRPWMKSDNQQRLDPNNGLLLTSAYDTAFDKGLITFNDSGILVPSESIDEADLLRSGIQTHARLRTYDGDLDQYMSFHRENVFKT